MAIGSFCALAPVEIAPTFLYLSLAIIVCGYGLLLNRILAAQAGRNPYCAGRSGAAIVFSPFSLRKAGGLLARSWRWYAGRVSDLPVWKSSFHPHYRRVNNAVLCARNWACCRNQLGLLPAVAAPLLITPLCSWKECLSMLLIVGDRDVSQCAGVLMSGANGQTAQRTGADCHP